MMYSILDASQRRSMYYLLALMIVGMMLEMAGVGLVFPVLALMTDSDILDGYPLFRDIISNNEGLSREKLLIVSVTFLLIAYVAKNAFLAFFAWYESRYISTLLAGISKRLFSTYLYQPYTFHIQNNSAQLMRNVHGEVSIFVNSTLAPTIQIVSEALVLAGLCVLVVLVEPYGMLIIAFILGLSSWLYQVLTKRKIVAWGKARQHHDGKKIQHLKQGLGGVKEVKLLGQEKYFVDEYAEHAEMSARMNQYQVMLQKMPRLWLEVVGVISISAFVLVVIGYGGDIANILPTVGLFAAAGFRVMPSINRIMSAVQRIRYGFPSVNTLHHEFQRNEHREIQDNVNRIEMLREISLVNVSYIYPGSGVPVLDKLNLTIRKGDRIALVGQSGSGKSTLVDIIIGIFRPSEGVIKVDGEDIQKNIRSWQSNIGYVPQTIYLTDDTLRANIAFGIPENLINDVSVNTAVVAAELTTLVNELPEGLDTVVGEHGVRLSGGQRQRIGIARALYHAPLVLVLDEASSALDSETETNVMNTVFNLGRDKTVIIVTHRISVSSQCDSVYRIENGLLMAA